MGRFAGILLGLAGVALSTAPVCHAFGKSRNERFRDIRFDGSVPSEQRKLLSSDLAALISYPVQDDAESRRVMGLQQLSGESLMTWLEDRVQYVLGESYEIERNIVSTGRGYVYENPGEEPVIENPARGPVSGGTVKTIMTNVGTAVYFAGRQSGMLLGFQTDGWDVVNMTSPRVGVIQVGEGLFLPGKVLKDPTSQASSISRLGTLFHEARHSDGHGKTLGFLHAVCPQGHDYEGYVACDRNLNGPYTVGAHVLRAIAVACTGCTDEQNEILKLRYLDSYGRVIHRTPANPDEISAMEGLIETCRKLEQYRIKACESLPDLEKQLERLNEGTASTEWDDAPEGKR